MDCSKTIDPRARRPQRTGEDANGRVGGPMRGSPGGLAAENPDAAALPFCWRGANLGSASGWVEPELPALAGSPYPAIDWGGAGFFALRAGAFGAAVLIGLGRTPDTAGRALIAALSEMGCAVAIALSGACAPTFVSACKAFLFEPSARASAPLVPPACATPGTAGAAIGVDGTEIEVLTDTVWILAEATEAVLTFAPSPNDPAGTDASAKLGAGPLGVA